MVDWLFSVPTLLVLIVALGLASLLLNRRSRKRKRRQQHANLKMIADQAHGSIASGEPESIPRSAALLGPFEIFNDEVIHKLRSVCSPEYEHAMMLWRGQWYVRVAQASYVTEPRPSNDSGRSVLGPLLGGATWYSYRIELEVTACPPLRLAPIVDDHAWIKRPHTPKPVLLREEELRQPPRHGAGDWSPLRLPEPYSGQFQAFAAEHESAADILNDTSLAWLAYYGRQVESVLTIENGLLYANMPSSRLDPATIVQQIDTLIGFLDRTPLQPGDPRGQFGRQGSGHS